MSCISCKRNTVQRLAAKSDDKNVIYDKTGKTILLGGYLSLETQPNVGSQSGVEMEYCTSCGQIQGDWQVDTCRSGLDNDLYETMTELPEEFPDGRFIVNSDLLEQLIALSGSAGVNVSVLNIGSMFVDSSMVRYNLTGEVKMPSGLASVMASMSQEEWFAYVEENKITNDDMYTVERMHECIDGIKILCLDGSVSIENPAHSG